MPCTRKDPDTGRVCGARTGKNPKSGEDYAFCRGCYMQMRKLRVQKFKSAAIRTVNKMQCQWIGNHPTESFRIQCIEPPVFDGWCRIHKSESKIVTEPASKKTSSVGFIDDSEDSEDYPDLPNFKSKKAIKAQKKGQKGQKGQKGRHGMNVDQDIADLTKPIEESENEEDNIEATVPKNIKTKGGKKKSQKPKKGKLTEDDLENLENDLDDSVEESDESSEEASGSLDDLDENLDDSLSDLDEDSSDESKPKNPKSKKKAAKKATKTAKVTKVTKVTKAKKTKKGKK
jgi:hypothetical protein